MAALMSVRELVELAGETIDAHKGQILPNGKEWLLTVRPFMEIIGKRTNSQGGDPNRVSRAIRWAYAMRGQGTYEDLLRRPDFGPEFAALIPAERAEVSVDSVPQRDPQRFAPMADRHHRTIMKDLDDAVAETERMERAVADERVEAVRRECADELRRCREHLDSVLDAEAAAVSEVESLRSRLAERQAVVSAFEAHVRALEASRDECRAAEFRERELRVKAEIAAAGSDADCRAAVARAEAAEVQAEHWRTVAEQATANADVRVNDVQRFCNERILEVRSVYERLIPMSLPPRVRDRSRRKTTA